MFNVYCPDTCSYQISWSFDLFPQHWLLLEFTLKEHAKEVHKELIESIERLNKTSRRKLVKTLLDTVKDLAVSQAKGHLRGWYLQQPQRVEVQLKGLRGWRSNSDGGHNLTSDHDYISHGIPLSNRGTKFTPTRDQEQHTHDGARYSNCNTRS